MTESTSLESRALYNNDYFLQKVDGFSHFPGFDGTFEKLFERYQRNIFLLRLERWHRLLEIGCGRGEICIFHSRQGGLAHGVDYSEQAIDLANKKNRQLGAAAVFSCASFDIVKELPAKFDRILASEFIEHVSAREGERFVRMAYERLAEGGRLVIFTQPNTLQRKVGYPLTRFLFRFIGRSLPKLQPDMLDDHYSRYHLNEQNYFSLKKLGKKSGATRYRAGYDFGMGVERSGFFGVLKSFIRVTPLRHLFFTGLYLVIEK